MGTGHFMRCLTLARELRGRGARVRFISRQLPEHLRELLTRDGIESVMLATAVGDGEPDELAHSRWLGVTQREDAEDTRRALSGDGWDWAVVDHYALDHRWERVIRDRCRSVLVIDDLADRQHDCDVLLDPNYYVDSLERYVGKVPPHCALLLGPEYALLRPEFRERREKTTAREGAVKRVLVFFGGADADNYTSVAIRALVDLGHPGLGVDVVLGAQHAQRAEIERLCEQHRFGCHVQSDRMAELMAAADLAVGAGGSATWERCCLGLPTLAVCVAFNQERQLADAAVAGVVVAPVFDAELQGELVLQLRALFRNEPLRRLISRNALKLVDARGTGRILAAMGCSEMELRLATLADSSNLFAWRNHPSIRSVSRNAQAISWEEHQIWLTQTLSNPGRILLIGERQGVPVGVVRFDERETQWEVSIYLVPGGTATGLGQELLSIAEHWLRANRPHVAGLRATVLGTNLRSQRLFLRAGYVVESTNYSKSLQRYA